MTTDKYPRYPEDLFDLRQAVRDFLIAGNTPPIPLIGAGTHVRTQGSCFAINIGKALLARGIKTTYLEIAEWVNSPLANKVLFDHLLDPALPFAEPEHEQLMTPEGLAEMRDALPREDVFIFTLGVAPCMFRRGRQIPAFNIGTKNADDYEMRYTTVTENEDALRRIVAGVRSFNPNMQIVLTVSPVPINRSLGLGPAVEVDCISKSTLRVAVANVMRDKIAGVYYWPSFEIVRWLAPHAAPAYGLDDGLLRHVNIGLVDLIIDLFVEYYGGGIPARTS